MCGWHDAVCAGWRHGSRRRSSHPRPPPRSNTTPRPRHARPRSAGTPAYGPCRSPGEMAWNTVTLFMALRQWTVPQLAIMTIYNSIWSIIFLTKVCGTVHTPIIYNSTLVRTAVC